MKSLNPATWLVDRKRVLLAFRKATPFLLCGILCAWISTLATEPADWNIDAAPAVHALASGHLADYFRAKAMMGPFSTLLQAPLVALSGASGAAAYKWAVFPCLLAAALLGMYLARIAERRGARRPAQLLLALICVVNPLTFEALSNGHPEEILTAALAVAAVAAAGESRIAWSGVLLGLAVASKQWAVIAVLPALMVLPSGRVRMALTSLAVAGALFLPGFVAAPASFFEVQGQAAGTGRVVTPWSAWYPFASSATETYSVGGETLVAQVESSPSLADPLSHPLIVLLALAVPIVAASRLGLPLAPAEGLALFALLAVLRCVLDPVDNLYYHEPLLLALIGWDAFSTRGLPLRSLTGCAVALLFWHGWHNLSDPGAFNYVYLAAAGVIGCAVASSLFKPISWTTVPGSALFAERGPNFRD